MRIPQQIIVALVGSSLLLPGIIWAETSVEATTSTTTEHREPSPGKLKLSPPQPRVSHELHPVNTASGTGRGVLPISRNITASGTKIASGTRPLPEDMKLKIEHRDEMRDNMMLEGRLGTNTDKLPRKMGERMEDARLQRQMNRGAQIKQFAKKTAERIDVAIKRMQKITDRINSRIAKLKATGADTTSVELHIANALASIEKAKQLLVQAENFTTSWVPPEETGTTTITTEPGSQLKIDHSSPMRESFQKAGDELRNAQKEILAAIEAMKQLRSGTTASTTKRVHQTDGSLKTSDESRSE